MPIGVPRIIYCWGEELPAQWTDIYNFIFRRRMVFLMQYLDDELCNQICGLLINIHMEDRSKELEKKEMERSGVFSRDAKSKNALASSSSREGGTQATNEFYNKKSRSMEDLLNADEDLSIDDVDALEQRTLQKITTEWLNWVGNDGTTSSGSFASPYGKDGNSEPYLFYLAELLSKDFNKSQNQHNFTNYDSVSEVSQLLNLLKYNANVKSNNFGLNNKASLQMGEIYSPFRTNNSSRERSAKFNGLDDFSNSERITKKQALLNLLQKYNNKDLSFSNSKENDKINTTISNLLSNLVKKDFSSKENKTNDFISLASRKQQRQKNLRGSFSLEKNFSSYPFGLPSEGGSFGLATPSQSLKAFNYLNPGSNLNDSSNMNSEFRNYYRKQTERTLIDEESKKVFVIINSFGGSVGNGITVHDALQFIKAGSLTLALGVAASAASLALAGGTIGERYVTEGCHTMIHQPEGGLNGQASDIWIDSQEIMKIRLDVAEIYSLSTYRPRHKILRDLDRDFYLTASETIQYGLADEIATNEVMHVILEETNRAWDYHDSKQQRLLETRENASAGLDTQTQN